MTGLRAVVSWADVERRVATLVEGLRGRRPPFERVVGVARGGLVPAALVAAGLGVRRVETVQVVHYDGTRRLAAPDVLDGTGGTSARSPAATLVVDDVLETGRTLAALRSRFPGAAFAVLVAKSEPGEVLAAGRADPERWVVFPWSGTDER